MKPFNLEAALAGELVVLRDGKQAQVLYDLRNAKFRNATPYPLGGVSQCGDATTWTTNGGFVRSGAEHGRDIVGMWEEPKPRKYINGIEVPMHETNALEIGAPYFAVVLSSTEHYADFLWGDDKFDRGYLDAGLVFLTREDAIATAAAMKQFQIVGEKQNETNSNRL